MYITMYVTMYITTMYITMCITMYTQHGFIQDFVGEGGLGVCYCYLIYSVQAIYTLCI